jgi:phage shock protein C
MTSAISLTRMQWVRSPDGIIAGVCEGLGKQLDVNPWILRTAWLVTVLFFGTGLLFYLIMAYALPRSDKLAGADGKRYLGVCSRLSRKVGMDIGLLRALTVIVALFSFGATIVGYVLLYFLVPEDHGIIELKAIDRTSSYSR